MSEKLSELLSLSQRAEKMEYVNEESALQLYVDIFARFEPKVSKTYDSAIRLLEKRDRLEEALVIADKALAQIRAQEMSSSPEKYLEARERLERKLRERGIDPDARKGKPIRWQMVLALVGLVVVLILVLLFATPYGRILVNLDGKQSLENGEQIYSQKEKPQFPITERMIDFATKNIKRENGVIGAHITVQEATVGVGILTSSADVDRAKELVLSYLRYLSGAAAAEYPELNPSRAEDSGDRLGKLYQHYDLVIAVGTGTNEESIYLKGTMNAGGDRIIYRDDPTPSD
ncbi:MAG: hypothetical protein Q4A52_05980 [Bacillota bacterium]|nr:hypothetical protein [Bacillota bacterium]